MFAPPPPTRRILPSGDLRFLHTPTTRSHPETPFSLTLPSQSPFPHFQFLRIPRCSHCAHPHLQHAVPPITSHRSSISIASCNLPCAAACPPKDSQFPGNARAKVRRGTEEGGRRSRRDRISTARESTPRRSADARARTRAYRQTVRRLQSRDADEPAWTIARNLCA